jgi:hypothetical protein
MAVHLTPKAWIFLQTFGLKMGFCISDILWCFGAGDFVVSNQMNIKINRFKSLKIIILSVNPPPAEREASGGPLEGGFYVRKAPMGLLFIIQNQIPIVSHAYPVLL